MAGEGSDRSRGATAALTAATPAEAARLAAEVIVRACREVTDALPFGGEPLDFLAVLEEEAEAAPEPRP